MNKSNLSQILKMQEENYSKRIGTTFGIFRIDDVKYNWQAHTQEWVVSCTKCGHSETVTYSVGRDWLRGTGRSRDKCKHCKELKLAAKKSEKIKKREELNQKLDNIVGEIINGWLVLSRTNNTYQCICAICNRERKLSYKQLIEENIKCKRCDIIDFTDPSFIGKKYGNLTILEYIGGQFMAKCDCGFKKTVKCSAIVNRKTTTCGRLECKYHKNAMNYYGKHGELVREVGALAEKNISDWLVSLGYTVKQTPISQDYGVDIICVGKDKKLVAIQVKNNASTKSKVNVHAVQEVYAGGVYYGCEKFAVVSYTGYTDNAKKMADKLGVMLCNERCELFKEEERFPINTKHTWIVNGIEEPMLTTFKRNGWDCHNVYRFTEMNYEQVKQYFEQLEKKNENIRIRKELGVSQSKIAYRMKHMGMTFEQAVSEPNRTMGRPRKDVAV